MLSEIEKETSFYPKKSLSKMKRRRFKDLFKLALEKSEKKEKISSLSTKGKHIQLKSLTYDLPLSI
jgi:hypothetical protein